MATLAYLGHEMVHLRDSSYRWVDLKTFRQGSDTHQPRANQPGDTLQAVLVAPEYRDHYTSRDSQTTAPLHGPYRLEVIGVAAFDAIAPDDAVQLLRAWVDQFGPVSAEEVDGDLDSVYELVREARTVFRLKDLGTTAFHDFGWVLGEFLELVVVGPADTVTLLVASSD